MAPPTPPAGGDALAHLGTLRLDRAAPDTALDLGPSAPRLVEAEAPLPPVDAGFGERYQPRALLGEGGMGEVRLCLDARIGREVAMKSVRAEHGASDDLRARFLREARVQGQLEHPAIVPVYDLGVDPSG